MTFEHKMNLTDATPNILAKKYGIDKKRTIST